MKLTTTELDREIEHLGTAILTLVYEHIAQGAMTKLAEIQARRTAGNGHQPAVPAELTVRTERETRAIATVARSGWSDDPEERSREMNRRQAKAKRNRKLTTLSQSRKQEWAAMSPAKRKARLRAMLAGRQAKRLAV